MSQPPQKSGNGTSLPGGYFSRSSRQDESKDSRDPMTVDCALTHAPSCDSCGLLRK